MITYKSKNNLKSMAKVLKQKDGKKMVKSLKCTWQKEIKEHEEHEKALGITVVCRVKKVSL